MSDPMRTVDCYIERITKKYIIDYLNALLFSNKALWDGDDQFNELPIFYSSNEDGYRVEQRGALFVNKRTSRALRLSVVATESVVQGACYRLTGLPEPIRIDEGKNLFYPLDASIDVTIADLNLGINDVSSYSFADNTKNEGHITNKRLFAILDHMINSVFICIDSEAMFKDLINASLSLPPVPSEAHYKPVFGVTNATDHSWD